ncbi:MAG: NADH-quinone oxidoreductase subunit NuoH [Ignavibacteria bacterium]|nr:MAG: NADH-quinone oxidoreductase subunit NuoH [Ignavibacteria bacterium]
MDIIDILIPLIKIVVMFVVVLLTVAELVYTERKISAFIQNRLGPNRVGWKVLLQPYADVIKLLLKEDIVPTAANKFIHTLAPVISIAVAFSTLAVVPIAGETIRMFGRDVQMVIADVNIGILYVLALTSMGVYGLTLSGWSSNNKYSLLGGLRSSAQMISYELSMGLSVIGVVMVTGSLQLTDVVHHQAGWMWNMVLQPVGFVTFVVAAFAETNRTPFDLPEAEPELVGGYHTEYSSFKFALFFLAEYANMITASAIIVTLYLGGWQVPYLELLELPTMVNVILQVLAFMVKVGFMLFVFQWVRWTVPRFRYDQLMDLGWKVMLPIALANVIATGIVILLI